MCFEVIFRRPQEGKARRSKVLLLIHRSKTAGKWRKKEVPHIDRTATISGKGEPAVLFCASCDAFSMNGSEAGTEVVPTVEQASLNLRSLLARPLAQQPVGLFVVAGSRSLASRRALFRSFEDDGALGRRCSFSMRRSAPSYIFRRKALKIRCCCAVRRTPVDFRHPAKYSTLCICGIENRSGGSVYLKSNQGPSLPPQTGAIGGRALVVAALLLRYYAM